MIREHPGSFSDGSRGQIERVLNDVDECLEQGTTYVPGPKPRTQKDRAYKIELGSPWATMIAELMEDGWGIANTTNIVNAAREAEGQEAVGKWAVASCHKRMCPVLVAPGQLEQDNHDY